MIYTIYEIPGIKNGATKDWKNRRAFNFEYYLIEPIIVETIEGPDTEEFWQVVGDKEWEYADHNGYERGTHYRVIRTRALKGYLNESKRSIGFPKESCSKGGLSRIGKPNIGSRKLTQEQANEIRSKYMPRKYTQIDLAEEYGVTKLTIHRIIKNTFYSE